MTLKHPDVTRRFQHRNITGTCSQRAWLAFTLLCDGRRSRRRRWERTASTNALPRPRMRSENTSPTSRLRLKPADSPMRARAL